MRQKWDRDQEPAGRTRTKCVPERHTAGQNCASLLASARRDLHVAGRSIAQLVGGAEHEIVYINRIVKDLEGALKRCTVSGNWVAFSNPPERNEGV